MAAPVEPAAPTTVGVGRRDGADQELRHGLGSAQSRARRCPSSRPVREKRARQRSPTSDATSRSPSVDADGEETARRDRRPTKTSKRGAEGSRRRGGISGEDDIDDSAGKTLAGNVRRGSDAVLASGSGGAAAGEKTIADGKICRESVEEYNPLAAKSRRHRQEKTLLEREREILRARARGLVHNRPEQERHGRKLDRQHAAGDRHLPPRDYAPVPAELSGRKEGRREEDRKSSASGSALPKWFEEVAGPWQVRLVVKCAIAHDLVLFSRIKIKISPTPSSLLVISGLVMNREFATIRICAEEVDLGGRALVRMSP